MADIKPKIIKAGTLKEPPRGVLVSWRRRLAKLSDRSLPEAHGRVVPISASNELGAPFMSDETRGTVPADHAPLPERFQLPETLTTEITPAVAAEPLPVSIMTNRRPVITGDDVAAERARKAEQARLSSQQRAKLYHEAGARRAAERAAESELRLADPANRTFVDPEFYHARQEMMAIEEPHLPFGEIEAGRKVLPHELRRPTGLNGHSTHAPSATAPLPLRPSLESGAAKSAKGASGFFDRVLGKLDQAINLLPEGRKITPLPALQAATFAVEEPYLPLDKLKASGMATPHAHPQTAIAVVEEMQYPLKLEGGSLHPNANHPEAVRVGQGHFEFPAPSVVETPTHTPAIITPAGPVAPPTAPEPRVVALAEEPRRYVKVEMEAAKAESHFGKWGVVTGLALATVGVGYAAYRHHQAKREKADNWVQQVSDGPATLAQR